MSVIPYFAAYWHIGATQGLPIRTGCKCRKTDTGRCWCQCKESLVRVSHINSLICFSLWARRFQSQLLHQQTFLNACMHYIICLLYKTHTTRSQVRALKYLVCASRNSTCLHWVVKGCVFNKPTSAGNYVEIAKLLVSMRRTLLLAKDSNERQTHTHTQYIYIYMIIMPNHASLR